jgi:Protein of unknown function (DUF3455)
MTNRDLENRTPGATLLTVFTKPFLIILPALLTVLAAAQTIPAPEVPETIKVPLAENAVLQAHASGAQIYVCQQKDNKFSWVLKAPQAELHDERGAVVGLHYAGPTWKYKDGSEVTGKAIAKVDAPDPDSVPWLLLTATAHSGDGLLSRVSSIQRIHTKGGQPPAAADCNPSKTNTETKISYTADYYFYAPAK